MEPVAFEAVVPPEPNRHLAPVVLNAGRSPLARNGSKDASLEGAPTHVAHVLR